MTELSNSVRENAHYAVTCHVDPVKGRPDATATVEGLNKTWVTFNHYPGDGYLIEVVAEVQGADAPMRIPINGPALAAALEAVRHA